MLQSRKMTIASYPGGKSDIHKHKSLYKNFPDNVSDLIEPFAGLANFSIRTSPLTKKIILNDFDPHISSLLRCITDKNLLRELVVRVQEFMPISKDNYYDWKKREVTNVIDMALKQLVILNCSVSAAGGGYSREKANRKWYLNKPPIWWKLNEIFISHHTEIHNLDFEVFLHSLELNSKSFVYLDPPYVGVAKRGSLYGKSYNIIEPERLIHVLQDLDCRWLMSNRYTSEIRTLFDGYHTLTYTTYNDMSNTRGANPELLVANYPLKS